MSQCFVAIAPCCGHVVFASVISPDRNKENAREVAKMIRAGYVIETWDADRVRKAEWMCECKKSVARDRARKEIAMAREFGR